MSVVIVDYGSGNLRSAARAFERAVAEAELPDKVMVTGDPYAVRLADRVVLPASVRSPTAGTGSGPSTACPRRCAST